MPYQYIFPYFTILVIIILGMMMFVIDFWWNVPVMWKGYNWGRGETGKQTVLGEWKWMK